MIRSDNLLTINSVEYNIWNACVNNINTIIIIESLQTKLM